MGKRYVLFWFDVEDCSLPQTDDAAGTIAGILTEHNVRATMKVVGQKARLLRSRGRFGIIDALGRHAIGYHTDLHSVRPQPAEYMGPLDWIEGGKEFSRREAGGLEELRRLWGVNPVCYGQPGPNWAPQVFPVLREWDIPAYVSGFGYVGIYAQPFWYGGIINTSNMYCVPDRKGREVRHHFGVNFEMGRAGALKQHKKLFKDSYDSLEDGGVISIANHPCTLVMKAWHSTEMKSSEETSAGYKHFEKFVSYVLSHENVRTISADQLPQLYPDKAKDRVFSCEELLAAARSAAGEISFQEIGGMYLSAGELFGMFARFLSHFASEQKTAPGAVCRHLDGPAMRAPVFRSGFSAGSVEFIESVISCLDFLGRNRRMPDVLTVGGRHASPGEYFGAMARAVACLIEKGSLPDVVDFVSVSNAVEQYVIDKGPQGSSRGMLPPGFSAGKLLEQARLQTWTLKPAVLSGG